MHRRIKHLLDEHKHLPTMIKDLDIGISINEFEKNHKKIEELENLKSRYKLRISRMSKALDKLDGKERQLIELRYLKIDPLPMGQIAKEMNYSKGYCFDIQKKTLDKLIDILGVARD